jgi:adenosylcobinamide kinase / adenosylcobinamide-phosphate guanylyltransferase
MARLTLFVGGVRSGKSRLAQQYAERADGDLLYCATAEALDDEMKARIAAHQERRGRRWSTVECPIDLPAAIRSVPSTVAVLVDCLTLWLSNLLLSGRDIGTATDELLEAMQASSVPIIIVSNEVGMGIVPESALGRSFRDLAGTLNQRVVMACDEVYLVIAGQTLRLKPERPDH